MRRQAATHLLLFCLIVLDASAYAQIKPTQNEALKKKACDYLTKAEAESISGVPMVPGADSPFSCSFRSVGFTNSPPNNKQVALSFWFWPSPDANDWAAAKKGIASYPVNSSVVVRDVLDFGDAAIWVSSPGLNGTLTAFKGGTIQVQVTIGGGIPDDAKLQHAKAIAAKALGGTGGTGYAYLGTPKGNAADAAAMAKVMQQGKTYSQAPYITQSQFLKSVKEVSLNMESDPSLARYISAAEQRSDIVSELTKYGIAVRPNAPVSLLARVGHQVPLTIVRTYSLGGVKQSEHRFPVHDISVALKFLVRAGPGGTGNSTWLRRLRHLNRILPIWSKTAIPRTR
jgi:hypothetical protein